MEIYLQLALAVSAGLGFIYGLFRFFRKDSEANASLTYLRMIVFGIRCAMLGRLYGTLMLLVKGEYYPGFNVGMLGIIGSFLFFFSANFGQLDSVVDDGSSKFIKARIIALAAPFSVAALWCGIFAEYGVNDWALIRGFGSCLVHGICTVSVGLGISYIKKQPKFFFCGTFALLSTAIIYHATYNLLVQSEYQYVGILLPLATYIPLIIILKKRGFKFSQQ